MMMGGCIERYLNYENALKKAEKERKEINYGNYLGHSSAGVELCDALAAKRLVV